MISALVGLVLGFLIGLACRLLDIPLPAPPKLVGALLVVAMTLGYVSADAVLAPGASVFASPTPRSP
jgi:XapX domain-containing protein